MAWKDIRAPKDISGKDPLGRSRIVWLINQNLTAEISFGCNAASLSISARL